MTKKKFPTEETRCIDFCQCIYCGNKFDGHKATNNNLDCGIVECPKCAKKMGVYMSVEYLCVPIEG